LLIDEINHRVKNTLATVQSLATQTFRDGADPALRAKFGARLVSLGRAHDVLSARKWEGADLRDVVNATLEPFASANPDRIITDGLSIPMSSRAVVMTVAGPARACNQCGEIRRIVRTRGLRDGNLGDQSGRQSEIALARIRRSVG
jgi:HWE histidine kinase